ncbi:hypothetical protein LINPERPRIM_LOCUS32117, partial [Linum perenne]
MKHRLTALCKKSSMRKFEKGVRSFMRADSRMELGLSDWVTNDQQYWSRAVDSKYDGTRWNNMTSNIA